MFHPWKRRILVLLGLLCGSVPGRADDLTSVLIWLDEQKSVLDQAGIAPTVSYDGSPAINLAGGDKRGASYAGDLHLQIGLDGERLTGTAGLSGFFDLLWINAGQPSKYAGDAQGVSSLAAPPALRVYEAWLQYNVPNTGFSVLVGRYDLSTEFHRLTSANLFLNNAFGTGGVFGASGFVGPSTYPDPLVGVRLGYKPTANMVLRAAILDAAPPDPVNGSPGPFDARAGALLVAEAAFLARASTAGQMTDPRSRLGRFSGLAPYDDKIAIGVWYYTAAFNDLSAIGPNGAPDRRQGEAGAYFILDQLLAQRDGRRITGFLQLGAADPAVDRFGMYLGTGFSAGGVLASRPNDEVGIAAAVARNGSHYVAEQQQAGLPVSGAEAAIELTYLAQLTTWFAVQPDMQYVIHPDTHPRVANATTLQLRFAMSF